MKIEKLQLPAGEGGYFFAVINLLVGIAILMGAISIGIMLYAGMQSIGY